ncbi:MAG: NADH-quinone oxidoreductase subunit NuoG [Pseudomonadota bacterium]|nr:NADH-quinone oxidoreductase subunit NuoG [Pseudomonadota bacterium]
MTKDNEVNIEIDGEMLSAPVGSMLIQATDKADIYVPRFCYHRELSIAANCRMCLVEVEGAPKPLPACATPVSEGMKVFTRSEKALRAQQGTMEFLLINHPLDCPICDQGGECELQDLAMGYGSGVSQFTEGKRVVKDKNLGPLIKTDMTRCIHCTRCVRFGEEIAGLKELGAIGRGEYMEIGTYVEKTVLSELSGNVIDVCPVGALTSKPYRYSARTWEMKEDQGIAPHDMLGSNVAFHIKGQKVKRVVPRENPEINRMWLSDRDRFSYEGINSEHRLLSPKIKKEGRWECIGWEPALRLVIDNLGNATDPNDIIALASPSSTTEEFFLLQRLIRGLGSNNIDHRLRQIDFSLEKNLPLAGSIRDLDDICSFDLILLVDADPRSDVPLLNLRIREAVLRGSKVIAIDSLRKEMNYPVEIHKTVVPSALSLFLSRLSGKSLSEGDKEPSIDQDVATIRDFLKSSKQALIISGLMVEQHNARGEILSSIAALAEEYDASYLPILEGSNSLGAWLAGAVPHRGPGGVALDSGARDFESVFEKSRSVYFLLGFDPALDCASNHRLEDSLKSADFVVGLSSFETDSLSSTADLLLPIAAFAENEGTLVNGLGRQQGFRSVVNPAGDSRPAWKILRKLGGDLSLPGFDAVSCADITRELASEVPLDVIGQVDRVNFSEDLNKRNSKGLLEVLVEVPPYSVDQLVRHAESLQEMPHSGDDYVRLNEALAASLHLSDGDRVGLESDGSRAVAHIKIDDRVPPSTCLIAGGRKALVNVAQNGSLVRIFSMQGESLA